VNEASPRLLDEHLLTFTLRPSCCILAAQKCPKYRDTLITFPVTSNFEVMVDAEAGSAIHSSGAQFLTGVLVRDLSANTIIPATPVQASSGALKSNAWPEPYRAFRYTIKAADLNNRENHVCQIIAFLNVGVSNQDSSFALSPLFMLTRP